MSTLGIQPRLEALWNPLNFNVCYVDSEVSWTPPLEISAKALRYQKMRFAKSFICYFTRIRWRCFSALTPWVLRKSSDIYFAVMYSWCLYLCSRMSLLLFSLRLWIGYPGEIFTDCFSQLLFLLFGKSNGFSSKATYDPYKQIFEL